jgi:hypothetical protein
VPITKPQTAGPVAATVNPDPAGSYRPTTSSNLILRSGSAHSLAALTALTALAAHASPAAPGSLTYRPTTSSNLVSLDGSDTTLAPHEPSIEDLEAELLALDESVAAAILLPDTLREKADALRRKLNHLRYVK